MVFTLFIGPMLNEIKKTITQKIQGNIEYKISVYMTVILQ